MASTMTMPESATIIAWSSLPALHKTWCNTATNIPIAAILNNNYSGRTVNVTDTGVHISGSLTLGVDNGGTPSTTVPEITCTGTYSCVSFNSGTMFNFYDGKVSGSSAIYNMSLTSINTPSGYGVVQNTSNGKNILTLALGYTIDYNLSKTDDREYFTETSIYVFDDTSHRYSQGFEWRD